MLLRTLIFCAGSSSLTSAQPDVVVTGVSRDNTSNASAADLAKKTTQVAILDGVVSSIGMPVFFLFAKTLRTDDPLHVDVYPEHVGETLESLRFAQV